MGIHLVIGYGPAGQATARLLADQGQTVRVVSRSTRPAEPGIEQLTADAADPAALAESAEGASVIYNCACPPYHQWFREWPALAASVIAAAESSGAVLVVLSNLYGYGPVDGELTEELPLAATGTKGRVRAQVWKDALAAHEAGRIRMTEARASDFFGPLVTDGGHLASRVLPRLLRGKAGQLMGDPDAPHSWTYLPDVARTLVRLGEEEQAWGRPWHVPTAPARSANAMVAELAARAGVKNVPVRPVPALLVKLGALVSPLVRELQEVSYQFDRPFVVDSSAFTAKFGLAPTPLDEQVEATVSWWRDPAR